MRIKRGIQIRKLAILLCMHKRLADLCTWPVHTAELIGRRPFALKA